LPQPARPNGIICAPFSEATAGMFDPPAPQPMTPTPEPPIDVKRVLMDRALRHAERDSTPAHRPVLPRLVGLFLALAVMLVVLLAFDRFLASVQRFLDLPVGDPEPTATEPVVTEPPVTDPMPAYVVPEE
jgi:hypothetical protein